MRLPGFTAEMAFNTVQERYRLGGMIFTAGTGVVLPQFCFTNEGGTTCCQCYFGYCYCHRLLRAHL